MAQNAPIESRGFVFAATGDVYINLARRAARSLRLVDPDAQIDLFADAPVEDDVFSQVHLLSDSWFRPKMECILKSRFDRTIFLDADAMVVGDLGPAFDVLDRFDLAGVQDRRLNSIPHLRQHQNTVPSAFPQINGGMLAVKRNEKTNQLMEDWRSEMQRTGAKTDQPSLRELLYTGDIRFCALPPNYNLLTFADLKSWWGYFGAPRVLHSPALYRRPQKPATEPYTIRELVGPISAYRMRKLIEADYELSPDTPEGARKMYSPIRTGLIGGLARVKSLLARPVGKPQ